MQGEREGRQKDTGENKGLKGQSREMDQALVDMLHIYTNR